MTNLEKASKAYDRLMETIGEYDEMINDLIYREVIDPNYTIETLVELVQYKLNMFSEVGTCYYEERFSDDYHERTEAEAEIKKYKYFIKKWQNVSDD